MPSIVSAKTFALAGEPLEANKAISKRRIREPSLLQGLAACGNAMYRTSTRISACKIYYCQCLGADSLRQLNGPVCDNRPVRQNLLDAIVWKEVIRLIEDPSLIEAEIARRLRSARNSDPNQQRENELERHLGRTRNSIDRLINAYQEELITIDEL